MDLRIQKLRQDVQNCAINVGRDRMDTGVISSTLYSKFEKLEEKVTLRFETPTAAGIFLDSSPAKNLSWDYADPLNQSANLSLRHRRDMNLNRRQLFLSPGEAAAISVDSQGNATCCLERDALLEFGILQRAARVAALKQRWRSFSAPFDFEGWMRANWSTAFLMSLSLLARGTVRARAANGARPRSATRDAVGPALSAASSLQSLRDGTEARQSWISGGARSARGSSSTRRGSASAGPLSYGALRRRSYVSALSRETQVVREDLSLLLCAVQAAADEEAPGAAAGEPLWGRRFEYRGDLKASGLMHRSPSLTGEGQTQGQWTCLTLKQLQELRACLPSARRRPSTAGGELRGAPAGRGASGLAASRRGEACEQRAAGADERAWRAYEAAKATSPLRWTRRLVPEASSGADRLRGRISQEEQKHAAGRSGKLSVATAGFPSRFSSGRTP
ncbi:unnamed protein product [Prorocentrum cordatum]|uniref:Uncharacterized protein n=1 Tax=Prorocentrum cordatum TaxID=2364126 RepID=A0ABN9T3I2_9DINO|nr:unnamed protein product [Polarella glacialis]